MSNVSNWLGPPYKKTNRTDFAQAGHGVCNASAARTFGRLVPRRPVPHAWSSSRRRTPSQVRLPLPRILNIKSLLRFCTGKTVLPDVTS